MAGGQGSKEALVVLESRRRRATAGQAAQRAAAHKTRRSAPHRPLPGPTLPVPLAPLFLCLHTSSHARHQPVQRRSAGAQAWDGCRGDQGALLRGRPCPGGCIHPPPPPATPTDRGGNAEAIRESQRRRFADVGLVDKVLELDEDWRKGTGIGSGARGAWIAPHRRPELIDLGAGPPRSRPPRSPLRHGAGEEGVQRAEQANCGAQEGAAAWWRLTAAGGAAARTRMRSAAPLLRRLDASASWQPRFLAAP